MIKMFLGVLLLLIIKPLFSQNIDYKINTDIYISYYSLETHTPLFVIYKLYKGGGKCSRESMTFKLNAKYQTANHKDYSQSGWDIGHMCNAEDFAFDCSKEILTFQFYNALPQSIKLNRGAWKETEAYIRYKSQKDSILIICGGFEFKTKIKNKVGIPNYCFKITKSLTTNIITCYLFPNNNSDSYAILDYNRLMELLPKNYQPIIDKTLKN